MERSATFILIFVFFVLSSIEGFRYQPGGIALLDHLNINHESGRHDLLKQFYFETLGLSIDPRKEENIAKGRKGLWANAGITQFHLSEGEPNAQVLDGLVTLSYKSSDDFMKVKDRLPRNHNTILRESKFNWWDGSDKNEVYVTDPWGSHFRLVYDDSAVDTRGRQPGPASLPSLITDLTFHVPSDASLEGIGRFYEYVFEAPSLPSSREDEIKVIVSPFQTLSFRHVSSAIADDPSSTRVVDHTEEVFDENGIAIGNRGVHISLYVKDMVGCFLRAEKLGGIFVNNRFKRQARSLDEAVDQCMFRCLDIIDPRNRENGAILRLEHEVRSMVNKDGTKYKSCPLDVV